MRQTPKALGAALPAAAMFLRSAALLLLATAAAKLISSAGTQEALQSPEPISGVPLRTTFVAVSLPELAVALLCALPGRALLKATALASLATALLGYRLGLLWLDYHLPCACLGNLALLTGLPPKAADLTGKLILAYILAGSYALLLYLYRQRRASAPASEPSDMPGRSCAL